MAENIRLNKVLRELNISIDRAIDFLESKSIEIEKRPTTKISLEIYNLLSDEFQTDANKKVASNELSEAKSKEKEAIRIKRETEIELLLKKKEEEAKVITAASKIKEIKKVGKIDLKPVKAKVKTEIKVVTPEAKPVAKVESPVIKKPLETSKEPLLEKPAKKSSEKLDEKSVEKSIETIKGAPKVASKDIQPEDEVKDEVSGTVTTQYKKLSGLKSTGETIDLSKFKTEKKKESPA